MILSTFFNKSKPINFIIVAVYMVIFYLVVHYRAGNSLGLFDVLLVLLGLAANIFAMLGIDFVAKRNELCKNTSHCILLFAIVTTILPVALSIPKIVIANCAIILAIRRIISLRSERDVQKKILDASLWIVVASACYFWSVLFFAVLFLGIGLYARTNYRNWLIPVVGVMASYILVTCCTLFVSNQYFSFSSYIEGFSLFFLGYKDTQQWITIGLVLIAALFFLVFYLLNYKNRQARTKPALILIIFVLAIAVIIALIAPQKNTGELFFITLPVAIMGTSYLESGIKPIFKEGFLWILVLLPIIKSIF